MSYQTWHNYGYGICTDDIETDCSRLLKLISLAPNFNDKFQEKLEVWMGDNSVKSVEDLKLDEILDVLYYMDLWYGIASVISVVVCEAEDIGLVDCDDFIGCDYVIFPTRLPWEYNEKELNMTVEDAENIFRKYVGILTDKTIVIDWQSVENGG